MNTCKNYNKDGGDTTVIGGVLNVDGGTITFSNGGKLGGLASNVALIETPESATAPTVAATVNQLIAALMSAGVIKTA